MPLKRKYAFIFAGYNNPCGAAGKPGNRKVSAANPPDVIANFTSIMASSPLHRF
jgi:hypothetical protein